MNLEKHRESHTRENSWWIYDARNISLARVCDVCQEEVIKSYPPEVTGISGNYTDVVDEPIEEG